MSIYDKSSLVLIPSGTKTGKVYSQKPTNGDGDFTFTRASAATRVNADGNIEKETQNLLPYSNTFSNAAWAKNGTSVTSGQGGYDGSSNASLLNGSGAFARLSGNISVSGVFTISVYAKANTANYLDINMLFNSVGKNVVFDLVNGVKTAQDVTPVADKMTDVGNGWWKIELTLNGTLGSLSIAMSTDGTIAGFVNFTSGSFYIQDAQVEQGLVARDVLTTTTSAVYGGITDNVPRLDYTDSSCPALLLEPLRTNQLRYSEYQSADGFILGSNITWNGFVESPEGVNNASRFTSNVQGMSYVAASGVVIPSGDFTFSMWVKGVSGTFLNRPLNISGLSGTSLVYMNETPVAGEDWKLVYGTGNNTGSAVTKTITLPFYDQPVGSVLEIYAFQLEAGTYATSYIPTYGSSVSRNLDSLGSNDLQASGVTNNATGWTYIVKGTFNGNGAAGNNILVQRDEGGFFYRYGSSFGFSGATKGYWAEYNPNGGFAYIWDGTQLRVRRGGTDIRTISAADIGWSAGGTSNWTINYVSIARISFELENAFIFNQALTNEEIDSLV